MAMSAAKKQTGETRGACGAAGWLAYAASPTFAVMALMASNGADSVVICSTGSSVLPIDGMTAMYLLMCLFHLTPWLKLASNAGQILTDDKGD